jgi:CDP-diacylglycerol--serine O-phosphatidyltransferase
MSIEQREHERRRPSLLRPLRPRLDVRARRLRRGVYLLPSMFTMANLFCGYACIVHSMRQELSTAALFIGFAFVLDMLDGRIARMTKTTTEIGVQLDSIADVVTFGLAPAVLAYVWGYGAALREGSDLHRLAWFLSFMYLMCGAFRLARFNVQSSRPRILAEGTIKVDKKSFVGLPIPVAGGLIAAIIHFNPLPLINYGPDRARLYSMLLMALVGILSILMVSTLRFSSFKTVGTRRRSMRTIMLVVAVGMLIFLFSRYVLLGLVSLYILHGLASRVIGMFRKRTDVADALVEEKQASP